MTLSGTETLRHPVRIDTQFTRDRLGLKLDVPKSSPIPSTDQQKIQERYHELVCTSL